MKFLSLNGVQFLWESMKDYLDTLLGNYQAKLESGVTIKTINNISILGNGNVPINKIDGYNLTDGRDLHTFKLCTLDKNGSTVIGSTLLTNLENYILQLATINDDPILKVGKGTPTSFVIKVTNLVSLNLDGTNLLISGEGNFDDYLTGK